MVQKKKTQKAPKPTKKTGRRAIAKQQNAIEPVAILKLPWPYILLIVFSIGLYINTIPNDYAFDDSIVVTENNYTKEGIKGIPKMLSSDFLMGMWGKQMKMYEGGRYRPLSLITLAIEYELFGENPHISHFINALLYALTALLLFVLLQKLLGHHKQQLVANWPWYYNLPLIITLLFVAHPIHTEVVANIKGRDEILTLLSGLAAWWFAIKYIENKSHKMLIYSGLSMFAALMSKESAITFLTIIPLSIYIFTTADRRKILVATVPILIASLVFLRIRASVLGGLPESAIAPTLLTDSFVNLSLGQRYATTIYTYGVYLKLLFFPHPLTYDYYPQHIPVKQFSDLVVWLIAALQLTIIGVAAWTLRRKSVFAFGVIFFWMSFSVVSNIFFSIGVYMSERFMYIPSLGFIIALVWTSIYLGNKLLGEKLTRIISLTAFAVLLAGFTAKTIDRNRAWKNNFTLFTTDVLTSRQSIKSTSGAGEALLFKARKTKNETERNLHYDKALDYFTTTIEHFPDYIYVLIYLGDAHLERNRDHQKALEYYSQVFTYRPNYEDAYKKVKRVFKLFPFTVIDADTRIAAWERIKGKHPQCAENFEVNAALGRLYGPYKNDMAKAIYHLTKAATAQPQDADIQADLGVAYSISGQLPQAAKALNKASVLRPNSKLIWTNLARVYENMKKYKDAQIALNKARASK